VRSKFDRATATCDDRAMPALGVLLVEDDEAISAPLPAAWPRGVRRLARRRRAGRSCGRHVAQVALVILDVGLPFLDGLEVCRQLRAARPRLQILLLTARSRSDAVDGLDAGADDYIAKPFRLAELLAGPGGCPPGRPQELSASGVRVDTGSRRAFLGETELTLSPKEFDLLARLIGDAGQVVTRATLLRDVWNTSWSAVGGPWTSTCPGCGASSAPT